jgi:hypothetical protein
MDLDDLRRLNAESARQLGFREHPADCICHGKGYHDGIAGPVECGYRKMLRDTASGDEKHG